MRIAIIAHSLRSGGTISVGKNIIAAMGRVAPDYEYFISVPNLEDYTSFYESVPKHKVLTLAGGGNIIKRLKYEFIELPAEIKKFSPDILLCLGNMGTVISGVPQVIMCHDAHLFYPGKEYGNYYSKSESIKNWIRCIRFYMDLRKTKLVICQTQIAEALIRKVYNYENKIFVCPNSISEDLLREKNTIAVLPESMKANHNIIKLFYPSGYYPHKNFEILVELFDKHKEALKNYRVMLTIDERQHPRVKKFLSEIATAGLQKYFINLGTLKQNELYSYYHLCDAVLMPTLLESFSGVYLEALYFRKPILTSDFDFIREICGDAAIYFDPYDVDSIFFCIKQLNNNNYQLFEHKAAIQFHNVFRTWDDIAKDILNEFSTVLA